MMAVRIAVARSEFTSFNPALANTAVSAAKNAETNAYSNQLGIALLIDNFLIDSREGMIG